MDLERRFAEGDLTAFETLFRAHQDEVYRWIVRIVRDSAVAEDLTIETFWRVYRARRRFDPDRSFGAWLRTIATNVARKHVARKKPEISMELFASNSSIFSSKVVVDSELRTSIFQAFQSLPEKLRTVALLALVEEVPYAEIGKAMELSVNAVKARMFRAVRMLRTELKKKGIQP